jgi:hypothetical protein
MLELLPYNLLPLCNNVTTPNQVLPTYFSQSCDVVAANPLSPSHSVSAQSSTLHIHLLYSLFLNSTPHNIAALNTIPRKKVETNFHLPILYHNLHPSVGPGAFAPVFVHTRLSNFFLMPSSGWRSEDRGPTLPCNNKVILKWRKLIVHLGKC